ncbi:MAG: DNA gyrase subunit A, partial [Candidatus Desulforudis sp.]|nr:DNA gyrase subunit A [Desulforudis sp.]
LARITVQMLADIDKETVDFIPNYDGTGEEPVVLPSRIPNLLVNGSAGIAVGMATNIPPHNLREVINGLMNLADHPDAELEELMRHIPGPDFPTGGLIMGREGILDAYRTGRGSIKTRGVADFEKQGNRTRIVITELPYQVNKARMVEKIAALVREKKIEGITDLRDESDRRGMRVVIELRREAKPQVVLNLLYKHTQLQESFGVIMLALVGGQPRVLGLKEVLAHYLAHQKEVITRRCRYLLEQARSRLHIVEGLRIALTYLDDVIRTIRRSRDVAEARRALMEGFKLSEKQAQAILDMRLQRLTALERDKLEAEYNDLVARIEHLDAVLADEQKILGIVKEELLEVREKFKDRRRTVISDEDVNLNPEDLVPQEDAVIIMTNDGYIKRMSPSVYRSQKRGGRGIMGVEPKVKDFVRHLFVSKTHDYLLFFTGRGKVYRVKVYEIPETGRHARGAAVVNLIQIANDEHITAVIPVTKYTQNAHLFMATRKGVVKKTVLEEFDSARRDGLIALNLDEGDELVDVKITDGESDIILGTKNGLAIRFKETAVRPMGRAARGVRGIALGKDDRVVGMGIVDPDGHLLVVNEKGYGKLTPLTEFRAQGRGGRGLIATRVTNHNGPVVSVSMVERNEEILLVSRSGIVIRFEVREIPRFGRQARGVRLMRLGPGDAVVAVARFQADN